MRETPNPDGNADDTQSPIHTLFVLQDIASGGGLTDIAMDGTSSGAARRPAILNAIDGSDDSEYNKLTISTAVKWWGMNLIDPIPE